MFTKCPNRKNAVIFLIIAAALMVAAVIAVSSYSAEMINAGDIEGRERYLNSFGWEIDLSSEECREITLPREFDGIMEDYAKMQSEQGFKLYDYAGLDCKQYTYTVTNYEYDCPVYATLYVRGRRVIAGDIHSAAIDGFMHGIKSRTGKPVPNEY